MKFFYSKARILFVPLLVVAVSLRAGAATKLPKIFSDHMVLQQGAPVVVWGDDDPRQKISVTLGADTATATADANGKWRVQLPTRKAGGGPLELTVTGTSTVQLHDVLIGEVWLCSGQSNMEVNIQFVLNAGQEIKAANYPDLRLFQVARAASDEVQADVSGQWAACTPDTVKNFSGTAYFFGRDLHKALGVPVGIIESAWAGSYIESWISADTLAADPDNAAIQGRWQRGLDHYPTALADYQQQLKAYEKAVDEAKGQPKSAKPPVKPMNPLHSDTIDGPEHAALLFDQAVEHYGIAHPSSLWNGMIAPLVPLSIKGVVWYQGESNFTRAEQYKRLFPAMVTDWRKKWNAGNFPFVYVQLPNIGQRLVGEAWAPISQWAELREAQCEALKLPDTAMVVTIDIGNGDIHPNDKAAFGRRLATAAQGAAYHQNVAYKNPRYESMSVEDGAIRIHFKDLPSDLSVKNNEPLGGFVIAGDDKKWVRAEAKLDGAMVVVKNANVLKPIAVRYGWEGNPACNLMSAEGLPVTPFRTDDWPVSGTGKK